MKIKKVSTRWWVYLDPESELERRMVWGCNQDVPQDEHEVFSWLSQNVNGWAYDTSIKNIRGDDHDYTVVRFWHQEDAVLFKMNFETQTEDVEPMLPEWKDWSDEDQMDPKATTFEKTNNNYFYVGKAPKRGALKGREIAYWYSTERNAAGFFLGWRTIDRRIDPESYLARRKKKDVIAWAKRKARS